jgi:hypothetical protein
MKIFVSSTYRDLETVRATLLKKLAEAGFDAIAMEFLPPGRQLEDPAEWSCEQVKRADIFVALLGRRFGARPFGGINPLLHGLPIVVLELKTARHESIPILAYRVADTLWDSDNHPDGRCGEEPWDESLKDIYLRDHFDEEKSIQTAEDLNIVIEDVRALAKRKWWLRCLRNFNRLRHSFSI